MSATQVETPILDLAFEEAVPFAEDVAPKTAKRGRAASVKAEPQTPAYRAGVIAKGFENIYATVGMTVFAFDQHCGQTIIENSEKMAASLDVLAKNNPAVRRVLSKMLTTSAWSEVIIAHAPLVMAIAGHHVPAVRSMLGMDAEEAAE
jgi:hypothetical protein